MMMKGSNTTQEMTSPEAKTKPIEERSNSNPSTKTTTRTRTVSIRRSTPLEMAARTQAIF